MKSLSVNILFYVRRRRIKLTRKPLFFLYEILAFRNQLLRKKNCYTYKKNDLSKYAVIAKIIF